MDNDRLAILEQKRQRLQELRQRRAELSSSGTINFSASPEPLPRTKVDVSVQVDLPPSAKVAPKVAEQAVSSNKLKFEKGVQTNEMPIEDVDTLGLTDNRVTVRDQDTTTPDLKADFNTKESEEDLIDELEKQLSSWKIGIPFSDLRKGNLPLKEKDASDSAPFQMKSNLRDFVKRPIVQVVSSPHFPDLLLVSYGKGSAVKRSSETSAVLLAGLAIIYNVNCDVFVPEFFLQCASPITFLAFDRSNPAKVFGGLDNGCVVLWDLSNVKPNQVAVLPMLQTSSIVSQDDASVGLEVVNHSSPILYLGQPMWKEIQDPAIVSICTKGVINLWSPNLLAFPKTSSIKIDPTSTRINEQIFLSAFTITTGKLTRLSPDEQSTLPEFQFLNLAIVGTKNGSIYRTCKTQETLLGDMISASEKRTEPYNSGITALVELGNEEKIFLSFHADWNFKIWNSKTHKLLSTVPNTTAIRGVAVRPQKYYQFVTYGDMSPPNVGLCVEYWDLEIRLFSPVFVIATGQSRSGTAAFSEDGDVLYVAYENGDIDAWDIDEKVLVEQSSNRRKPTVDKGLATITLFNKQSIEI